MHLIPRPRQASLGYCRQGPNRRFGENANPGVVAGIREILDVNETIMSVNEVATLHMGPEFIVVTISVDFIDSLSSGQVEDAVTGFTKKIKATDPRIQRVFIEAEGRKNHCEPPELISDRDTGGKP